MTTMRAPRLVAETATRPRGKVVANPAIPNLFIVKRVGSWPIGAIVEKAALPHGFQGHLDLGVVIETDRPITHETALKATPATAAPPETTAELARLRGVVADLEGQKASLHAALVERDERLAVMTQDLAAAEEMLKGAAAASDVQTGADEQARLAAGPTQELTPTPKVKTKKAPDLPVVPAPWKD